MEGDILRLLRIAFGFNLDMQDVNSFFIDKIQKKFKFWNTIHLFIVEKGIIVHIALNFIIGFYMAIWAKSTQKFVNVKSSYGLGKTAILGLNPLDYCCAKKINWWPKFSGPIFF